ncbi:A/G-specific adenine glycosylase [Edaphobacter sp. HDX4]|uniref:A/G-specific adenine glycosylase n=1 Tax=Edaphobacter sp. HDX4 TaxID=2794064 RepID=UPI002FE607EA
MQAQKRPAVTGEPEAVADAPYTELDPTLFRRRLMSWYRMHARELPWRGVSDPYRTWVSEVMLQQTRVAAVIEHYNAFLRRFPTILALALASEDEVLAAWSGLGYYRRARMLHRAAKFITEERGGVLPSTAAELRTLPGIGEYTCGAIASIAFGESVPVLDGNVERVLLRLLGRPEDGTSISRTYLQRQAAALVPRRRVDKTSNAAGDHNQAMMELGATICLPRAPLCLNCPVFSMCKTRGEHVTPLRAAQRSRPAAHLLSLRKRGPVTQVLLERRATDVSLMAGMYELPPLPLDAVEGREPLLRVRHSITNTNYYVQVFAPRGSLDRALRRAVPAAKGDLHWIRTSRLPSLPLTGLARKILQRLDVMEIRPIVLPDPEPETEAASSPTPKRAGASRPASKITTSPYPAGARE